MSNRKTVIVSCPCGKQMTRRPSELVNTRQPYCSRECLYKYRPQSPNGRPTDEWRAMGSRPRSGRLVKIPRSTEIEEALFADSQGGWCMKGFLLSLVAVAIVTGMAVLSVLKTDAYVEIKNRQANIEAIADDQAPVTGPAVAKR